jgi:hypothetical protein
MADPSYSDDQLTDVVDRAARNLMKDEPDRFTAGEGARHKPNAQALIDELMKKGMVRGSTIGQKRGQA